MSDNVKGADNQQERFLVQLDPSYVVGLVDGEGYFSIYANRRKQNGWIMNDVRFTFGVKLKASDGIAILNALQKFFDCGFVYFRKDPRENFCDCYEFQVNTHKEIFSKIIPFFERYPLQFPSKRKTFDGFCKIAEMVQRREHIKVGGVERVKKLALLLH